jgi:outer membrane protein
MCSLRGWRKSRHKESDTMRVAPVAVLLLALSAAPAAAQAPPASPTLDRPVPAHLTLDEAIARALEMSHVLAELRAREGASAAVVDQRHVADLPVVSAQGGYQRTNHVDEFGFLQPDGSFQVIYPDVPDNFRSRLDMQWPIYTGGRAQALERAADAERQASGSDVDNARADLRLETTRAFWAVVTAIESVRVVREAVTRSEGQLHDVQARRDAGFLPPNDVLTVQTRLSRQRSLLIEAENQREAARAALSRLIGAPLDASYDLDAVLEEPAPPGAPATGASAPGALQTGATDAIAHRADRQALLFRTTAAEARIDSARAGLFPVIGVGAGVDYARPNPRIFPREAAWKPSWDVGVNLTWTLWNWGRTSAEVAEARLQATALRERLAELDTQISLQVRQRQLDLDSARAQVAPATEAVASATEARRVVQARFQSGVATSSDLLDAQQDLLEAELGRTRSLAEVRLAEARLARALGH